MNKPQANRYILCVYVPATNGKTDKIPLNHHTLNPHNPLDESIHLSYDQAKTKAAELGSNYGVGFVFLKHDNYFFIDLDNCLTTENTWSETALNTLSYFPGAYVEVSHSGKGLHIIGTYTGEPPVTGKRLDAFGIEIYTEGRFCALTGTAEQGNAQADHTSAFNTFVKALGIAEPSPTAQTEEWTTEDDPDTNVPQDNAELIKFILNRPLTQHEAFGGVVSFKDLWENNVEVLAKHFPSNIPGKEYDYSSADAALAYRLMYFAGRNCQRVLELMYLSKLKRDKWEHNVNYLPRTIAKARGSQCISFSHARSPQTQENNIKSTQDAQQSPIQGAILDVEQQLLYFQGCTYIADIHQMLTPGGVLYKPESFNAMYGGVSFLLDRHNQKITRKAFEAFTLSQAYAFPKVHGTCFKPLCDFGEIITENDSKYVNIYRPTNPPRVKADVQPFLTHLEKLLPNAEDRLILLSYMASLIQYKGIKFTWCVIIQGVEGNGKSFLNEVLAYCIGRDYVHSPKSSDLTGKFNGWIENKLLITVDDIYQTSWDMLEILKPMITNRYQEIERKGIDKITREVYCNFILNTNHQDGIRKTRNDRRFAPLFTAQQTPEDIERDGMGGDYFPELFKWFNEQDGAAAINEYLNTFEIPDKYNPTTSCIRAPITSSTEQSIEQSLDPIAQRILEWVGESCVGFRNGWISSVLLYRKLLEIHIKISPKRLYSVLKSIGYDHHPALEKGRSPRIIKLDGSQSRLYITSPHPSYSLSNANEVVSFYEADQQ